MHKNEGTGLGLPVAAKFRCSASPVRGSPRSIRGRGVTMTDTFFRVQLWHHSTTLRDAAPPASRQGGWLSPCIQQPAPGAPGASNNHRAGVSSARTVTGRGTTISNINEHLPCPAQASRTMSQATLTRSIHSQFLLVLEMGIATYLRNFPPRETHFAPKIPTLPYPIYDQASYY